LSIRKYKYKIYLSISCIVFFSWSTKNLYIYIWFGFYQKKKTKLVFLNQNRFKPTGFGSVGYFRIKTGSNWFLWFGLVFPVWLSFLDLARFFSSLTWFFSVWVWFGFRLIKPEPNRSVFLNYNQFFSRFGFFG